MDGAAVDDGSETAVTELVLLIQDTLQIEVPLEGDTPLLTTGFVDSFGVVVLLSAFEDHYGVEIDEAAITFENFDTPAQMLACIVQHEAESA